MDQILCQGAKHAVHMIQKHMTEGSDDADRIFEVAIGRFGVRHDPVKTFGETSYVYCGQIITQEEQDANVDELEATGWEQQRHVMSPQQWAVWWHELCLNQSTETAQNGASCSSAGSDASTNGTQSFALCCSTSSSTSGSFCSVTSDARTGHSVSPSNDGDDESDGDSSENAFPSSTVWPSPASLVDSNSNGDGNDPTVTGVQAGLVARRIQAYEDNVEVGRSSKRKENLDAGTGMDACGLHPALQQSKLLGDLDQSTEDLLLENVPELDTTVNTTVAGSTVDTESDADTTLLTDSSMIADASASTLDPRQVSTYVCGRCQVEQSSDAFSQRQKKGTATAPRFCKACRAHTRPTPKEGSTYQVYVAAGIVTSMTVTDVDVSNATFNAHLAGAQSSKRSQSQSQHHFRDVAWNINKIQTSFDKINGFMVTAWVSHPQHRYQSFQLEPSEFEFCTGKMSEAAARAFRQCARNQAPGFTHRMGYGARKNGAGKSNPALPVPKSTLGEAAAGSTSTSTQPPTDGAGMVLTTTRHDQAFSDLCAVKTVALAVNPRESLGSCNVVKLGQLAGTYATFGTLNNALVHVECPMMFKGVVLQRIKATKGMCPEEFTRWLFSAESIGEQIIASASLDDGTEVHLFLLNLSRRPRTITDAAFEGAGRCRVFNRGAMKELGILHFLDGRVVAQKSKGLGAADKKAKRKAKKKAAMFANKNKASTEAPDKRKERKNTKSPCGEPKRSCATSGAGLAPPYHPKW